MARIGAMGPTMLASQTHIGGIGDIGPDAARGTDLFWEAQWSLAHEHFLFNLHLVFYNTKHWHSCRLHLRSYALVALSSSHTIVTA
jgi:hypothetical protein